MPNPVDVNFSELFSLNHLYIPEFQRGYSWTKSQLEDLWIDIGQIPEGKHHYCGSILTVIRGEIRTTSPTPARVFKLELVDGQQRCTTIFLLLLAIRDRFLQIDLEHPTAAQIDDGFIHFTPHGGSKQLKLKNEHDDLNTFMKNLVLGNEPNPTVAPEKRLVEAKTFFDRKIAEYSEEDLNELRYTITTKLVSTEVYLDDSLDQPTVFEAINNRGLGLSAMDKLKNYSMLLIGRTEELENENLNFEVKWFSALQHLMKHNLYQRSKEDKMLKYYWTLIYGSITTSPFDAFKQKFSPLIRNPNLLDEEREELVSQFSKYVEGFVKFAEAFTEIEARTNSYNIWGNSAAENESRKLAALLHEKQDNMSYPDLMLAVVIASYIRFNHDEYTKVLSAIEKTLFRVYHIINKQSQHGYSKIGKLAGMIYSNSKTSGEVVEWLHNFATDEGDLGDIRLELENRINSYKWAGIKYFLHEYERHLGGGMCINFDVFPKREQSIEHILPQTPEGIDYWDDRFDFEQKTKLTNNLGNLCLTQDNSYYHNFEYPRKREGVNPQDPHCYLRATTHQEKKLANEYEHWNPENLRNREEKMVRFALERWKFDEED